MSKVDYDKFKPQQTLQKVKGRAEGVCFLGVCAVSAGDNSAGDNGVVVLVAVDIETLEIAWGDVSTVPLDKAGVQRVAIFSQDVMTPI